MVKLCKGSKLDVSTMPVETDSKNINRAGLSDGNTHEVHLELFEHFVLSFEVSTRACTHQQVSGAKAIASQVLLHVHLR